MDTAQILRRIIPCLAAGLLAATGQAATLKVDNATITLTGSIQSQLVNVTSSDGTALNFDVGTPTYLGAPAGLPLWLNANATGCTNNCPTPAILSLSVTNDLGQYGPGPFHATVGLAPHGGSTAVTIAVNFFPGVGGPTGSLMVSPSALNPVYAAPISYTTGQQVPTQQVIITGTTSYTVSASTLSGGPWLLVSAGGPNGTQIPSTPASQILSITLDPGTVATLAAAVYQGFVIVTGADGTSLATIDVNLAANGGTSGAVTVTPTQLTFAYSNNASPLAVPAQTLVISTPVGSPFTATTDHPEWIVLPASANGNIPGNLPVLVNPPATPGTYTGHITITSGSIFLTIPVQLVVSTTPVLWAETVNGGGTVLFTAQGSVSTPASQNVSLVASDGSKPGLTLISSPSWAGVALNGNTLAITPTVAGAAPAVFSGAIVINASGVNNSPLSIPIVLVANGGGASGPLTLNPSTLSFTALAGGVAPPTQTLTISAPTTTAFNVATSTTNNIPWLQVSPSFGGATDTTLTVTVLPALLSGSATPYNGSIILSIPNTTQTQTVPVVLTVAPTGGGNVKTDSTAVNLTAQTGTAKVTDTITVSNVTSGTAPIVFNVTTSPSATWLKATPAQAATQSQVTITADPTGLAANTYMGQVTITPTGGTPVIVNVTFTVQGLPVISASQTSFTFTYLTGAAVPASQTVQISGGSFTAAVTTGSDWLLVSPGSGTTTTNLTISVKPAAQSSGSHAGVITVTGANNTLLLTVTLNVTLPFPVINGVLNGASLLPGAIVGGEVISIVGVDLGPTIPVSAQFNPGTILATTLAGVRLQVNGFPTPLLYVSSTQITAVVPYEVARFQQATVQTSYLNQNSNVTTVAVTNTSPAIFTVNSTGTGSAARNADLSPNGSNNPAPKGGTVIIYMTGEGPLNPPGITGTINPSSGAAPPMALLQVQALIDNQPANVTYAGGIRGVVEGITQLIVQIPQNIRSGDLPLQIIVGGNGSQVSPAGVSAVTVSVQ
ncbi:MAG TPA: hypothetical protein VG096_18740 [Bryobacteraceae bacterium]|jgi:uncharacterized protein (TIGR03437 family)|nr:hypothetical protein [Bryobacteraceae bacterium]